MPLVSVVIPSYNRAHTIERALKSVTAQTIQDFEILIVDDASTDNTVEVLEAFGDSRIRYFRHDENQYAGPSRNTGMAAAKGKYIAFLDSDDAWLPEKLETQIGLLEGKDKDCDCSYTGAILNLEDGLIKRKIYKPEIGGDALIPYLFGKFTIWPTGFLFRASLLEKMEPFDPELIRVEDVDFFTRMFAISRLSCITEPMIEMFLDLGKDVADAGEASDRIFLNKHRDLIQQQGQFLSRYIYATYEFRIGERYLNEGRILKGLKSIFKAMLLNPFLSPKRYVAMLLRLFRALWRKVHYKK